VRIGAEERVIAAEDAARYRDALGCAIPVGLPVAFTDPVARPLEQLVGRYARTHGPFLPDAPARRFDLAAERVLGALAALEAEERVVRGEFRPDGLEREWCDTDVLRQLRRRSLAALRREVEPVEQEALARFLPAWHGIPAHRRGLDALVETLGLLQGAPLVASTLERDVLPARVLGYRSGDLDDLCTSGDVVWVGAGSLGASDGRLRLCFRDQLAAITGAAGGAAGVSDEAQGPGGKVHEAIRQHLREQGASFWNQLRGASPGSSDTELLAALWDLVWAGEVTNDSLAPLRAFLSGRGRGGAGSQTGRSATRPRGRPRPGRLSAIGPPAGAGRWSLVAPLLEPKATPTEAAHVTALQLLERHGVLTRESVLAEGVPGGFTAVYGVLKVLEERGQVRRGYFVTGLGAAQFALPGAVDRLRSVREVPAALDGTDRGDLEPPLVLATTDPAQPYGAALAWPESAGRPARAAGSLLVLRAGRPLVWMDRRGHHLVLFPAAGGDTTWADALASLVKDGRLRSLEVRTVDGEPVASAPEVASSLRRVGFADGYRGLVLRGG
jgi:ATP-dependent Lhr-like helicase